MEFTLTEEQQLIRQTARQLADEFLAPRAAHHDQTAAFTADQVRRLGELGFLGMQVPEAYGGSGLDTISYVLAMEEVSRGDAATSVTMTVQNSLVNWPLSRFGSLEQQRKYLPKLATGEWLGCYALTEPVAGSDPASMGTGAVEDGDAYVLNGSKIFISNGGVADLAIVWAQTHRELKHKGVTAFILEKGLPGFEIGAEEHKMGIRGSNTVELYFKNCRVPKSQILGGAGEGFKIAMMTLDGGRIGIAAQAVGIAQAALDAAAQYAQQRKAFGRPIAELEGVQFKIADMAMEIQASRLLTYLAAWTKDQGQRYSQQAAMAKLHASETATRVTHMAVQVHGGYGYLRDFPVERLYRDARITEIYEGTSEIQRIVIAGQVLKGARPATE
ncbi:MAG TPA: acyl-CoA dehydrogenase family protein [Chloroflexia bacterium]|nr:acyl-CoA dehydrogenase family protein [Chloroflexia bacterium]